MSDKRFKGKIALWFYIFALVINIIMTIEIYDSIISMDTFNIIVSIAITIFVDIIFVPVFFCNYTEFRHDSIFIRFGLFKLSIKYIEIRSIRETKSILSSYAASFDRIEIKLNKNDIMISVEDKRGFFDEMKLRKPDIFIG